MVGPFNCWRECTPGVYCEQAKKTLTGETRSALERALKQRTRLACLATGSNRRGCYPCKWSIACQAIHGPTTQGPKEVRYSWGTSDAVHRLLAVMPCNSDSPTGCKPFRKSGQYCFNPMLWSGEHCKVLFARLMALPYFTNDGSARRHKVLGNDYSTPESEGVETCSSFTHDARYVHKLNRE